MIHPKLLSSVHKDSARHVVGPVVLYFIDVIILILHERVFFNFQYKAIV